MVIFSGLAPSMPKICQTKFNSRLYLCIGESFDTTLNTVCPGSSDPFYIVTYYIKCVTTFWTHNIGYGGGGDPMIERVKRVPS